MATGGCGGMASGIWPILELGGATRKPLAWSQGLHGMLDWALSQAVRAHVSNGFAHGMLLQVFYLMHAWNLLLPLWLFPGLAAVPEVAGRFAGGVARRDPGS